MSKHPHYLVRYDGAGNILIEECAAAESYEVQEDVMHEEHFPGIPDALPAVPKKRIFPIDIFTRFWENDAFSHTIILANSLRFVGTFAGVFLLLFIGMNYGSYASVMRAVVFPDAVKRDERALDFMTNAAIRRQLLVAPELPRAGSKSDAPLTVPDVAPPDNRLIIPKIGKNVPIVEASDSALRRGDFSMFDGDIQNALKYGVVHYPGTADPGEPGNVFLTGHSSNYLWVRSNYNAVFALLPQLTVGDEYSVFFNGTLHRYRIIERKEVSPKDVSVLDQPSDAFTSTLMTCTPVGTTLRRLVLRAEEVDLVTGEARRVL